MGWCAPERGHVALLEPLAQLSDALRGVGAAAFIIEAAELVPGQAATRERGVSMALTQQRILGAAAHFSSLSTPFPLMQLAIMMAEATPSPLRERSIFSVGVVPLSASI